MPTFYPSPVIVPAAGEPPKIIEEYAGRASNGEERLSIARMISPSGWYEPAQTPEFDEYTVVLRGTLQVECGDDLFEVTAGQAILARAGETVRYSSPGEDGAEYLAICLPAFSPALVNRES